MGNRQGQAGMPRLGQDSRALKFQTQYFVQSNYIPKENDAKCFTLFCDCAFDFGVIPKLKSLHYIRVTNREKRSYA